MKPNFLFLLLLGCVFNLHNIAAQLAPCGTIFPPEADEPLRHVRQIAAMQPKGQQPTVYIPVKVHIVGTDSGAGYFEAAQAYRLICEVNEDYIPANMYFYVLGELNYINNSEYYIHDFNGGENMMNEYNVSGAVNVYIVDDPAGNCGYFSWGGDALAVAKACSDPGSTTLTHELGHYFFLPHTFRGWEGAFTNGVLTDPLPANQQERVDGSNCSEEGDGFCDTPADYISYRWSCPYNGGLTDPTGTPIQPDEKLYMSYSLDGCQGRFSNEQMAAMQATVNEFRSYLIQPQPNIEEPSNTYIYYPPGGGLAIDPDHILCTWRPVGNAEHYLLTLSPSGVGEKIELSLTDTFYVANLSAGTSYTMTVLPINSGNACATPTIKAFNTAANNMLYVATLGIDMPECVGGTASLSFEAAGGTAPYSYAWSNGVVGNTNSNLNTSTYFVTVTDAVGTTAKLRFTIPAPIAISPTATVIDNTVTIDVTGGFPPFNFDWVTGANSNATQSGIPVGTYDMLITDVMGCTTTVNYTVSPISVQEPMLVSVGIVSNLLQVNEPLRLNIGSDEQQKAQLSIVSTAGQTLYTQTIDLLHGNQLLTMPTQNLPSGIYYLSIQTNKGTIAHKFVVM
jgi:hypothetical protein